MDFGPYSLGGAISSPNNLSLVSGTGKYFNPVLGLPLRCNDISCADPLFTPVEWDNSQVSTTVLSANLIGTDVPPTLSNFPVGNSDITNPSLTGFAIPAGGSTLIPAVPGFSQFSTIIKEVIMDDPVSQGNPVAVTTSFPAGFDPGTDIEVWSFAWDVPRGYTFNMFNGGASNSLRNGRYTAAFTTNDAAGVTTGVRCSVRINEED
jgi:hypothetical protein